MFALMYVLRWMFSVLANISAPEFLGPFYNDSDVEFYFICRVLYADAVEMSFDVTLLFDGEEESGVAFTSVSSVATFDVVFKPEDFVGQYGKMVCQLSSALSRNCAVIAKFHYTGPTGPDQTKSTWVRAGPRGSGRVRSGPCSGI